MIQQHQQHSTQATPPISTHTPTTNNTLRVTTSSSRRIAQDRSVTYIYFYLTLCCAVLTLYGRHGYSNKTTHISPAGAIFWTLNADLRVCVCACSCVRFCVCAVALYRGSRFSCAFLGDDTRAYTHSHATSRHMHAHAHRRTCVSRFR